MCLLCAFTLHSPNISANTQRLMMGQDITCNSCDHVVKLALILPCVVL